MERRGCGLRYRYCNDDIRCVGNVQASLEEFFAQPACESLRLAQQGENGLKQIYGRIQVLKLRPARALHSTELTQMIDTLKEVQTNVDSEIKLVECSQTSMMNLERLNQKLNATIDQLTERLNIFTPQTELRNLLDHVHSNLIGAIYEAAVVNRLQRSNPIVGRTVGYLYPNQLPRSRSRKELDVVIRKAGTKAKDIWIESKFVSAEGMLTNKDYPWIEKSRESLLHQLRIWSNFVMLLNQV